MEGWLQVAVQLLPKRNNMMLGEHNDFHFTCAQVNYMIELSEVLVCEMVSMSADNNNKLTWVL